VAIWHQTVKSGGFWQWLSSDCTRNIFYDLKHGLPMRPVFVFNLFVVNTFAYFCTSWIKCVMLICDERPEDGENLNRRWGKTSRELDGFTEGMMRAVKQPEGEIGCGMPFPLLHYCSVYLVSTLNHCGPTQLEGQKHRHLHVCVTHTYINAHLDTNTRTFFLLLFSTLHQTFFNLFLVVSKTRKKGRTTHTNTHQRACMYLSQLCSSLFTLSVSPSLLEP